MLAAMSVGHTSALPGRRPSDCSSASAGEQQGRNCLSSWEAMGSSSTVCPDGFPGSTQSQRQKRRLRTRMSIGMFWMLARGSLALRTKI